MHNLRHFYYQNKEKIWKVVLIIAFLLGLIYYINDSIGKENTQYSSNKKQETSLYKNEEEKTYISDKSAISGELVTEDEVKKINDNISKFLQYCKNRKIELAYNMIAEECKESEFETLQKFQEKYIKTKFTDGDTFKIENWTGNTYKIEISKDPLTTGIVNDEKHIEYITIDSKEKLNINGYIGKKYINKKTNQNNISIEILSKDEYIDYEIYDLKIENFSNKTIKIDTLETGGKMYLEDIDGKKYNAYIHEILENDLEIKSNRNVNLKIKYGKSYLDKVTIKSMKFENVVLDYLKYMKLDSKNNFEDKCEIEIKFN